MAARDHTWQDDALQLHGKGRGWIANERWTCVRCGLERRINYAGKDEAVRDGATMIYFVNGERVSKAPECKS